ncbi:MAG: radical SAM protein [Campylobacterota bacterium]|nr:radical SAM protein [Campylobacterota bacterium]
MRKVYMHEYGEKFNTLIEKTNFANLYKDEQLYIKQQALHYRFSFQELKQLIDMAIDFNMWNETSIIERLHDDFNSKKEAFRNIRKQHDALKNSLKSYTDFDVSEHKIEHKFSFVEKEDTDLSLGMCPVASPNTRCCNLLTLDAVESCGFDCSYCSIQSFYNENQIGIDINLAKKLEKLELDPNLTYHIGTGQSSDSLMWGNRGGILEALFAFARRYPNVILEFKTKSDNISYFLENEVPHNIICTYSLNTPTIVEHEEHLSASLEKRIKAARRLADKGIKVGFHFHPIVQYENYLQEYGEVYKKLIETFQAEEVVMVSMGTLTFIKPVIKQLRDRNFKSKILQMPLINANGKQSYPLETKQEMFKHAYDAFAPWHNKVFFYLCMENHSLWRSVFGYEYASNNHFEEEMLKAYKGKIISNFSK